jgi:uncharacterized protein involved in response to NO
MIHPSMLVSEIGRQYPQCRAVFEKYGIAGCGGEFGPPEPLFIFAAAHRVPLQQLVEELNQAARGQWKETDRSQESESRIQALEGETLYKRFVFGALLVALTLGFGLGVVNLTRIAWARDYAAVSGALKQIHGHAQIFGWVGLFIMGVAFHAVPRMKMQPLRPLWAAKASWWLMLTGLVARVAAGLGAPGGRALPVLSTGSAFLELAAVGLFVWLLGKVVLRSQQKREPYEKFILASLFWFAVLAVWNCWIVWHRMPALHNALWIHVALFGFIANMIFGFSLRVLPHFMGLRESKPWAANAAFWIWNAAILVRHPSDARSWAATWMELVAALLFVYALGIFTKRRAKIEIAGVDNTFAWFVVLGYVGLVIAVLAPLHADHLRLGPSSRHLMAVGFITPMIFGVAHRVLPVFNGVNLWSDRLMRATFWHLAAGTTLSFAMAFNKAYPATWNYAWSGVAGWLVFAALVMFAVNIAMTLRTRHEPYRRGAPVTLHTRVAELLEAHPELRPVLIHAGLAALAAMRHNPPRFVTLEFAARRHGLDPASLVAALNAEISGRARPPAAPQPATTQDGPAVRPRHDTKQTIR